MNKYARYLTTFFRNIYHPLQMRSGPIHLQIEVTTHCNLACVMCPHPTLIKNPRHMTLEQFKLVFDTLKPLKISLSGLGEPFLNPDMPAIIRYATDGGAQTITTSNLTVVSEEKACQIIESGLYLIKGSIDSNDPETYAAIRKRNLQHKVLEGLKNLRDAKRKLGVATPRVRLQFVMQKSNFKEIPQVIDLGEKYGVDAIYFQPIDLSVEEYVDEKLVEDLVGGMDKEEFRSVLERSALKAEKSTIATNLPELFKNFESVWAKYRLVKSPDPPSATCLMPWTSIYITVDGDIRPCCSFGVSQETTIGNIFRDNFLEVWNSNKYQAFRNAFREGKRPHKICQNCIAPTLFRIVKSSKFSKFMLFR